MYRLRRLMVFALLALLSSLFSFGRPFSQSGSELPASFNLLGIVHAVRPSLVTVLTYTDGSVQTVESDLSAALAGFHDIVEPLDLEASLSVPVGSGFSASITGWRIADGGKVDAH